MENSYVWFFYKTFANPLKTLSGRKKNKKTLKFKPSYQETIETPLKFGQNP